MRRLIGWTLRYRCRDERGDVPGWVMITVMTILLVSALFAAFNAQVTSFFQSGLDSLTSG